MRPAIALLGACLMLAPSLVRADDDVLFPEDAPRVYAIEERPYELRHELSVGVGVLPLDAFYVGTTLGGAYTLHLSQLFAWEALNLNYSVNRDTSLEDDLLEDFDVIPVDGGDERITLLATSDLVFKPLFGKLAVFNRTVVFAEAFLVAGGGSVRLGGEWRGSVNAGAGFRLWAGDVLSFRFDLRDHIIFAGDEIENALQVGFGAAITFGKGQEAKP